MTESQLNALVYKRQHQAKRRAGAIAAGLCITCCKRPHEANVVKCKPCGGRGREEKRTWTKQPDHFCVNCQAHRFHREGCKSAPKEKAA